MTIDPSIAMAFSLVAIVAACWALARQQRRHEQGLDALRSELSVFAEASIRLADTVDRAMTADLPPVLARSARRQVLNEARARLAAGRSPLQIGVELGLSEDEQALLSALPPIAEPERSAARSDSR